MPTEITVFISSKMIELKNERDLLFELLPTLNTDLFTFKGWVFEEDAPATEKSIREVYLNALRDSQLYLGLFWNEYGQWTIDEYDHAAKWAIPRHVYVKDLDADQRVPKLANFLNKSQNVKFGITHRWYQTIEELAEFVKADIKGWVAEEYAYRPGWRVALVTEDVGDIVEEISERPKALIGRDALKTEAHTLLNNGERVLLHGFGGMGKTALAALIAEEWLTKDANKLIWLKIGSEKLSIVGNALARPFNQHEALTRLRDKDYERALHEVIKASKANLLIIDDAWNAATLDELLTIVPTKLPVLVTSRKLHPNLKRIEVDRLHRFDSITTLSLYADSDVSQADGVNELCRCLGDHPFSIEIAGSVLDIDQRTPQHLYEQIRSEPYKIEPVLDVGTNFSQLLEISLHELDNFTRLVFRSFGALFSGTATPELLSLVLNNNVEQVTDALIQLARRSLARRTDAAEDRIGFYGLHDLAYSYAQGQIGDEQRLSGLHACLAYTERYNQPSRENFMALEPELKNLVRAVSHAFDIKNWVIVRDMAYNLWNHSHFLDYRSYYQHGIDILEKAILLAKKSKHLEDIGKLLCLLGFAYDNIGQYDKTVQLAEEALEIAQSLDDNVIRMAAFGTLGSVYIARGAYYPAIDYLEKALNISNEIGDAPNYELITSNLGIAYDILGQSQKAIHHFELALRFAWSTNNQFTENGHLNNLGMAYFNMRNYKTALTKFEKALVLSRTLGKRDSEMIALGNLGMTYKNLGDFKRSLQYHQEALDLARETSSLSSEASSLTNIGITYKNLEQYDTAITYYEQALVIAREIKEPFNEAKVLGNMGFAYRHLGQYDLAIDYYEQARSIFLQLDLMREVQWADNMIVAARNALG